jgi:hypothetical protein
MIQQQPLKMARVFGSVMGCVRLVPKLSDTKLRGQSHDNFILRCSY